MFMHEGEKKLGTSSQQWQVHKANRYQVPHLSTKRIQYVYTIFQVHTVHIQWNRNFKMSPKANSAKKKGGGFKVRGRNNFPLNFKQLYANMTNEA